MSLGPLIRVRMENDSVSGKVNNGGKNPPHGNKSHVSGGLVSLQSFIIKRKAFLPFVLEWKFNQSKGLYLTLFT